jgi:uncharacterized membrane protein
MSKNRLEAFSDGVIAILITIMVLELKAPPGSGWSALHAAVPSLLTYVLSFVFLGIYWNNHHHLLHATDRVNGKILWANLHLLFWLSLIPFVTSWMGEHYLETVPTAVYGIVMLAAAIAYKILQNSIVTLQGRHSALAAAFGSDFKGKISPVLYVAAIVLAFLLPTIAQGIFVFVAMMWLVPDRRIESGLKH